MACISGKLDTLVAHNLEGLVVGASENAKTLGGGERNFSGYNSILSDSDC